MNAIETRGLTYRAGKSFELKEVALNVPAGSVYGFLGPNGSGKTTTIRLLMAMAKPIRGEIRLLGHEIPRDVATALSRIGYVPERPHLYSAFTIAEAIRYHASFYASWDAEWAHRLQREFDLPDDRRIGRLSKGETGKLMILLALAQRPELLILDEPTDGLDPMVRRDAMTAVLDYVAQTGATVFISSHLVHELERMCDWVGVLDHGRLVVELPMEAFKSGVKRIRLHNPPREAIEPPFTVLSRSANGHAFGGDTWVVRDWSEPMRQYFERAGAPVREVIDLDLEEVFVEVLRSSRQVQS